LRHGPKDNFEHIEIDFFIDAHGIPPGLMAIAG
jgi:hypothetical protein